MSILVEPSGKWRLVHRKGWVVQIRIGGWLFIEGYPGNKQWRFARHGTPWLLFDINNTNRGQSTSARSAPVCWVEWELRRQETTQGLVKIFSWSGTFQLWHSALVVPFTSRVTKRKLQNKHHSDREQVLYRTGSRPMRPCPHHLTNDDVAHDCCWDSICLR